MTEREYYRESEQRSPDGRQVYRETRVEQNDPAYPSQTPDATYPAYRDDATRDVYRQEQVYDADGSRVVHAEHVSVPSDAERRAAMIARVNQIIYFLFGALCVLIGIRFVLLFLGANTGSGFVQLIYGLTQPFVSPFLGIFGEPAFGSAVIEWGSLIAIAIYSLLAYGIVRLLEIALAPARETKRY